MAEQTGYGRWWENYLVRYLMPSIAGMIVMSWLSSMAGPDFRKLLFFGIETSTWDSPLLITLFLYGNLFCYVASYPILGFHVTRVLDFDKNGWVPSRLDGYIWTGVILILAILVGVFSAWWACISAIAGMVLALIYSGLQIGRLCSVYQLEKIEGLKKKVTKAYGFTYALARRRGEYSWVQTNVKKDENEGTSTSQKSNKWKGELIDTYRHMREHGNSAFIFVLVIALAGLCCSIVNTDYPAETKLALIGVLFSIWSAPAVLVHMLGQHIERRFSKYDFRQVD